MEGCHFRLRPPSNSSPMSSLAPSEGIPGCSPTRWRSRCSRRNRGRPGRRMPRSHRAVHRFGDLQRQVPDRLAAPEPRPGGPRCAVFADGAGAGHCPEKTGERCGGWCGRNPDDLLGIVVDQYHDTTGGADSDPGHGEGPPRRSPRYAGRTRPAGGNHFSQRCSDPPPRGPAAGDPYPVGRRLGAALGGNLTDSTTGSICRAGPRKPDFTSTSASSTPRWRALLRGQAGARRILQPGRVRASMRRGRVRLRVLALDSAEDAIAAGRRNAEPESPLRSNFRLRTSSTGSTWPGSRLGRERPRQYRKTEAAWDVIIPGPAALREIQKRAGGRAVRGYLRKSTCRPMQRLALRRHPLRPTRAPTTWATRSCGECWPRPPRTRGARRGFWSFGHQAPDHPVLATMAESEYLRGGIS